MTTRRLTVADNISASTTSILVGRSAAGSSVGDYQQINLGTNLSMSGDTLNATNITKTYAVFTVMDNQPPATNFATLDTRNSIAVLDFDSATNESAIFASIVPEAADLSTGLKVRMHWMATAASGGNCIWSTSIDALTGSVVVDSFATAVTASSSPTATGSIVVAETTITTIDGIVAGDGYRLRVMRSGSSGDDTMTGDAELVLVEIRSAT